MQSILKQANKLFNNDDHAGAAALYAQILQHRPLSDISKSTLVAASRTLGYQFSNGIGVQQNLRSAVDAYRIAVALDDPASTCNLASLWFDGVPSLATTATLVTGTRNVRQDHIRGANLLSRLLSRIEYVPALVELGRCYFTGEGVVFDAQRATTLWTRAYQLAISGKSGQTKEDLVPAIAECQRALREVRELGKYPDKFNIYQESTLEGNATNEGRYGPYTSPWGASGYVQFLRSKGIVVKTVSSRIQYDRLINGTYLRQPPVQELVALSAELHYLATTRPHHRVGSTEDEAVAKEEEKDGRDEHDGHEEKNKGAQQPQQPPQPPQPRTEHAVTAALRMFDEWEIKDIVSRFVCGARPDIFISPVEESTCTTPDATAATAATTTTTRTGGQTCLHAACCTGRENMVEILLNKGCDAMRVTSNDGSTTPWDLAALYPNIQLLLPHIEKQRKSAKKNNPQQKNSNNNRNGKQQKTPSSSSTKPDAAVAEFSTGDVLADGLRKGFAHQSNNVLADPLFHDPAFYLRVKKEAADPDTMQVLGAGKSLSNKSSYENQVLQEIMQYEEGEKKNQTRSAGSQSKGKGGGCWTS